MFGDISSCHITLKLLLCEEMVVDAVDFSWARLSGGRGNQPYAARIATKYFVDNSVLPASRGTGYDGDLFLCMRHDEDEL